MTASIKTAQLFSIEGLIAVITGGSSGLGLMLASALAENGAKRVYIVARDKNKLARAAVEYQNIIVPLEADVIDRKSPKVISHEITKEIGHINLLVANAGIAGPGLQGLSPRVTISEFVETAWSSSTEDFTSVYNSILAFLELLDAGNRRRAHGPKSQVIATASMASSLRDARYGFAYCSSKAALISMIKCFSTYCVPWGIRFNAIAAGLIPSDLSMPFLDPFKINPDKNLVDEGSLARTYLPAERAGSSEDLAGIILYMVSPAGGYVNGSVMLVGGKLATVPCSY